MSIQFNCPACGAAIKVSDSVAGRVAKCPNCKGPMKIPTADMTAVPKPASSASPSGPASDSSARKAEPDSEARKAELDPHLARIIEAWPALPEPFRRAMLALIDSTK